MTLPALFIPKRGVLIGAVAAALAFGAIAFAFDLEAQERRTRMREIKPKRISFEFDRLIVRATDEALEIEYVVDRSTWNELRERRIDVWIEVWAPMDAEYRFYAFNYARVVWPITEREATLEFPAWVRVNRNDRVGLCLLALGPDDEFGGGRGWVCDGTEWFRPRSDFSVQLSAGLTMPLERRDEPLRLLQLYWLAPYGPFFVPGWSYPFPENVPRVVPRRR